MRIQERHTRQNPSAEPAFTEKDLSRLCARTRQIATTSQRVTHAEATDDTITVEVSALARRMENLVTVVPASPATTGAQRVRVTVRSTAQPTCTSIQIGDDERYVDHWVQWLTA